MPDRIERYTVVIQDTATEMLVQHARFLAQKSEAAAKRLVKAFQTKASGLETMPERCPWLHDPLLPERKYRKLIFEKRYMLVFQVLGDKVFIDAMLDCRQDYVWLL